MIAQPRNGPFHDPAMPIAAHDASILRSIFSEPVLSVRRNHFYAQLGERFIQSIAIVSLVPRSGAAAAHQAQKDRVFAAFAFADESTAAPPPVPGANVASTKH